MSSWQGFLARVLPDAHYLKGGDRKVFALFHLYTRGVDMDQEQLLDEIEEWLRTHGMVQGVHYSEAAYLHRVKAIREAIAHKADA
jgi:hypothetical protein